MDIPIPTLLLALSILAVWLPSFSGIRLWVPIFMGAAGAGLYQHVLEPIGVLAIIAAWLLAWLTQTGAPHSGRRRVCTLALVLSLVALGSHWLPGFADTVVVPQTRVSPGGGEFHITMHFDVGVATLVMLVTFAPRLGGRLLTPVSSPPPSQRTTALPEWFQLTAFSAAISCAVVGIAWTFGYVHPNPKLPVISGIYFIRTLIWTAILESCFFQSVLQDSLARLKMFHASNAAPLIIVAIIFGWLHDRHFGMYFWLASLAGTGYGFSYLRWRTIEAPVIVHTCLDCVHFFFFSYPFLKPTIS